jgi:hypothetical protein
MTEREIRQNRLSFADGLIGAYFGTWYAVFVSSMVTTSPDLYGYATVIVGILFILSCVVSDVSLVWRLAHLVLLLAYIGPPFVFSLESKILTIPLYNAFSAVVLTYYTASIRRWIIYG